MWILRAYNEFWEASKTSEKSLWRDTKQWEVYSLTIWTSENSLRSRLRKFHWILLLLLLLMSTLFLILQEVHWLKNKQKRLSWIYRYFSCCCFISFFCLCHYWLRLITLDWIMNKNVKKYIFTIIKWPRSFFQIFFSFQIYFNSLHFPCHIKYNDYTKSDLANSVKFVSVPLFLIGHSWYTQICL